MTALAAQISPAAEREIALDVALRGTDSSKQAAFQAQILAATAEMRRAHEAKDKHGVLKARYQLLALGVRFDPIDGHPLSELTEEEIADDLEASVQAMPECSVHPQNAFGDAYASGQGQTQPAAAIPPTINVTVDFPEDKMQVVLPENMIMVPRAAKDAESLKKSKMMARMITIKDWIKYAVVLAVVLTLANIVFQWLQHPEWSLNDWRQIIFGHFNVPR